MTEVTLVAAVLILSITAYALFGGADFGTGFWDLMAGDANRGERPRALMDRSIGPVWEANHVWLIFCLVVLWTAFPEAFASIMRALFVPLALAALGILLRGSSFAFRHGVVRGRHHQAFGAIFAISSVVVPFCMGAAAGAVASGRVTAGVSPDVWLNPTSILGGLLAMSVCAYLAAVYLVAEASRAGDDAMSDYFRRRALVSAVAAGAIVAVGVGVVRQDARALFDGLLSRGLPFVMASAVCGLASPVLLLRRARGAARIFAAGAVASLVLAWGAAQWPYILPGSLTLSQAAAPSGTLTAVLIVSVAAVIVILPALGLLYVLDQKSLLNSEE